MFRLENYISRDFIMNLKWPTTEISFINKTFLNQIQDFYFKTILAKKTQILCFQNYYNEMFFVDLKSFLNAAKNGRTQ